MTDHGRSDHGLRVSVGGNGGHSRGSVSTVKKTVGVGQGEQSSENGELVHVA
jgi:hypothetical protein